MDKWNENYVDTIRYENVIKYIDNLFERRYQRCKRVFRMTKTITNIIQNDSGGTNPDTHAHEDKSMGITV